MFDISCLQIYRFYLDEQQINLTNQIVRMQGVKDRCIEEIYKQIFGYDDKLKCNFQAVDPQIVLNKFKKIKFVNCFVFYLTKLKYNLFFCLLKIKIFSF